MSDKVDENVEPEEAPRPKKMPRWITRAMAEDFSHRHVLVTTFREACVFLLFALAVSTSTVGRRNSFMFFLTEAVREQFINEQFPTTGGNNIAFTDIKSAADFWNYVTSLLLDSFYPDSYYDSQNPVAPLRPDDKKILFDNILLGVPRIRQVKMRSDSCSVHELFRRLFSNCYDMYSSTNEDKSSFGPGTGTAWVYNTPETTGSRTVHGQIATYSGGGYFMDLGLTRKESLEILNELKDGLWVTRGTRVVFVDFSLYNANVNLFCICKLMFEFPPTGGIISTHKFQSVQLIFYINKWDYLTWACEITVYILGVFYIAEEMREMFYFRWRYLLQFWSYIDILIIGMTIANLLTSMIIFPNVGQAIQKIIDNPNNYGNMEYLGDVKTLYFNNFAAALMFFTYVKIFKYLNFNKTMGQLNNTLKKCAWDIAGFSIMFFIIFIAFAQLGYLLFGSQVEDFSALTTAMFTLLRTLLGDFDYVAIERANRFLAPIYFLAYIFFVFFTLLNMFLAIINDSYSDVKTEILIAPEEMHMSEFLYNSVQSMLVKLGVNLRCDFIQKKTLTSTLNQIVEALEKCGFNNQEIKTFLKRFKIEEHVENSEFDIKMLIKDLEAQAESLETDERTLVHINDFIADKERLLHIEQEVNKVKDRINALVGKLDTLIKSIKSRNT